LSRVEEIAAELKIEEKKTEEGWKHSDLFRKLESPETLREKLVGYWYVVSRPFRWFFCHWGLRYKVKQFWQRGLRGWAISDTWSLDDYLSGWVPEAVEKLRSRNIGIPMEVTDADGHPMYQVTLDDSDESPAWKSREAIWDDVLGRIRDGFIAHRLLCDSYACTPRGRELFEELKAIQDEGLLLFAYNFSSLWD